MNGCIRQTVGPVIEERVQERKVLKNMLMELEEAENGWKCQYIIIINFFTVALSMDLISQSQKIVQNKTNQVGCIFFISTVFFCLTHLSSLPHPPVSSPSPSTGETTLRCHPFVQMLTILFVLTRSSSLLYPV